MMIDCEYCDGEGCILCEECNAVPTQIFTPRATPLWVHKQEVRYWEMVKQEIEAFNQQAIAERG